MANVYLIHFDENFQHAKHYLGFAEIPVSDRLDRHMKGNGSKLMRAVVQAGITVRLARVWIGDEVDRNFERRLKNQHRVKLYPICKGEHEGLEVQEY